MKKIFCAALSLILAALMLTGCTTKQQNGDTTGSAESGGKLKVITTIYPIYDFARAVGGDKIELTMLLSPGSESHTLDPTAQQMLAISSCDVFMYIGGEDDKWVDQILETLNENKITTLTFMDKVNLYEEETVEGMVEESDEADSTSGDTEIEYDAHIWTAPKNAVKMTEAVRDTLCEKDPDNAEAYKANAAAYIEKINAVDSEIQNVVDNGARKTIVVADRFPFRYLCAEFSLSYSAAYKGCSAAGADSSKSALYMINKVKTEKIPVVFYIEFSNEKIADTVCESTDAKKMCLYSCHNVSKEDYDNGVTYVDLMKRNVEALKAALN